MAKEETVKKRGGHARQRRYPGIKGRRPDKAAKRRAAAAAQASQTAERAEVQKHAEFVEYERGAHLPPATS